DRNVREGRPRGAPTPIEVRAVLDPAQDFREAWAEAERVKEAYRKALGNEAELQNWLGIGLIPLAAAAMGLGVSGGHTTQILALGLGGAAAFGTATWLSNRPRTAAYVAGYKAVTCAQQAVTPLAQRDIFDETFDRRLLTALGRLIPVVQKDIATV